MKRALYLITVATLLLSGVSPLRAQNTDGTDFWLTFGMNNHTPAIELQIRIASRDKPASGYIYFKELNRYKYFDIPAHKVYTYKLENDEVSAVYNISHTTTPSNKSIYIHSNEPITAYAMNQRENSTDATNLLPETVLGTDYYQISYIPATGSLDAYAIIATDDYTDVYHEGNKVITLNRGQVYYRTSSDMTGKYINTNKAAAFFALNQRVRIPHTTVTYTQDCFMQQLAPVNTWGKNFFVPVSDVATNTKDRVRIVASQSGTTFLKPPANAELITTTGGQSPITKPLDAGQFFELEITLLNKGTYFETDKPVGVCTYLTSAAYNNSGSNPPSDPAQGWLPSIEQLAPEAMIAPFIPKGASALNSATAVHAALIITPTHTKNNTQVSIAGGNFVPLTSGIWQDNDDAQMSFYTMPLSKNDTVSYRFVNSEGLLVMGYGYGYAESYYYLGYSSMRNLDVAFYANGIHYQNLANEFTCDDEVEFTTVFTEIENLDSVKWYINNELYLPLDYETWNYTFSAGNYEIKMENFYKDGVRNCIGILHIGARISVAADPAEGGSVEMVGDTCAKEGDPITLTAKPYNDYIFVNWTEEGKEVSIDNPYEFDVTDSRALVANFYFNKLDITVLAEPEEGGEVSGGDNDITHGSSITVEADAKGGYHFTKWTKNGVQVSDTSSYTFTATESCTLVAHFDTNRYYITLLANPEEGGTVLGDDTNIQHGTSVTVKAEPKEGYHFVEWTKNGEQVHTTPSFTFEATESCTLVAHFEINLYDIILSANPEEGGTVLGDDTNIPHGTIVIVKATEKTEYRFLNWTEDTIVSTNPSYTFTLKESRNLVANFIKMFLIHVEINNDTYGDIEGIETGWYEEGSQIEIEAIPHDCYRFKNWFINGVEVKDNPYLLTITGDMDITAHFYAPLDSTSYSILWSNTIMLNLKKLADDGYEVTGCKWFENGTEVMDTRTVNEFSYSAGTNKTDRLNPDILYKFQISTANNDLLCPADITVPEYITPSGTAVGNLFVYPNPVPSGAPFIIEGAAQGSFIQVYNQYGVCVSSVVANDSATTLSLHLPAGIYFIRAHNKEIKIVVI